MNILVVGSGGREHALCRAFSLSSKVNKIFCASGNAGIAQIAECVDIKPDDIDGLTRFAEESAIDLTFVGGEISLALGIVDAFEDRGLRIIGPRRAAANLEASKAFAKEFMDRYGIPTARFLAADSVREASDFLKNGAFGGEQTPVVVKADGLAAGKGVIVARDRAEAIAAVKEMETIAGAKAADKIILEECLFGREVSLIMFVDGEDFAIMPPTRDHKRIGENDTGPNTGGMGTITGGMLLSEDQLAEVIETVIKPTLRGCIDEGFPFRGILFLGLMMTANGVRVLEYNVRFGDPETQSILIRLETDIVTICEAMLNGGLGQIDIVWRDGNSACVVLAAEGYPLNPRTGDVINGLGYEFQENVFIYHAGTAVRENHIVTAGGRVLGVAAVGDSLDEARREAYNAVEKIAWEGMQFRRDIGQ